jgi:hypothetical protein
LKVIKIKICSECPHYYISTVEKEQAGVCGHDKSLEDMPALKDRVIDKKIPKWCPLEDLK